MLKSFLVLDLPMDASDQDIRKKYLELVKKFTPDKYPSQFQKITIAYESVKDQRSRVKSRLFSAFLDLEFKTTLKELTAHVKFDKKKKRVKGAVECSRYIRGCLDKNHIASIVVIV